MITQISIIINFKIIILEPSYPL